MADDSSASGKTGVAFVLSTTRDLAFLIAIFMVFAGLAYRNYLYVGQFNLPSYMMDASFNTLIFDAYRVLLGNWGRVLVGIVVAALVLGVTWFAGSTFQKGAHLTLVRALIALEAAILLILAFPCLDTLARDTAAARVQEISSGAEAGSSVHINPAYAGVAGDLLSDGSRTTIIDQTSTILFVYYKQPPDPRQPNAPPNPHVYVVPQTAVDYIDSMPPGGSP